MHTFWDSLVDGQTEVNHLINGELASQVVREKHEPTEGNDLMA